MEVTEKSENLSVQMNAFRVERRYVWPSTRVPIRFLQNSTYAVDSNIWYNSYGSKWSRRELLSGNVFLHCSDLLRISTSPKIFCFFFGDQFRQQSRTCLSEGLPNGTLAALPQHVSISPLAQCPFSSLHYLPFVAWPLVHISIRCCLPHSKAAPF